LREPAADKILLVGNPNVGKSVIFAFLTGRYTVVSNYPGTTVEVTLGQAGFERSKEVIDTPGVNSLFPKGEDEKVTRDILLRYPGATVVQIADAKNLFRALLLTTQLAEIGCRMILVLNMMDEARQRGISIDCHELSLILGIEVIETVAIEKSGLPRLVQALSSDAARVPKIEMRYPAPLNGVIGETERALGEYQRYTLFDLLTLFAGDEDYWIEYKGMQENELRAVGERIEAAGRSLANPLMYYIASARKEIVESILRRTARKKLRFAGKEKRDVRSYAPLIVSIAVVIILYLFVGTGRLSDIGLHPTILLLLVTIVLAFVAGAERINRITLHPVFGLLVLLLVLYVIYMLVGVFAAGAVVDTIEGKFFDGFIVPLLSRAIGPPWLRDFLVGEFGLVSMGLNYSISIVLPIVTVFFLVFGILEDTGYFPRLTVLTNRAFRLVGVNGKATLPIVLGFGCVTMATLASRILETKKERIIVVVLLALAVPCSAQLGVILALTSAISVRAVVLIGGILAAEFILVGRLMSCLLKGRTSDFILELPPLRSPQASNVLLKTGARVKWFLKEALPFFLLATVILFVLDRSGGLRVVHAFVEPLVSRFLGLPVETAAIFIVGFFRRDYGAAGLYKLWENGLLEGNQVVVALVVISLFIPCLATLIVMIKELGIRYGLGILFFVLILSIASGGVLNLVLRALDVSL